MREMIQRTGSFPAGIEAYANTHQVQAQAPAVIPFFFGARSSLISSEKVVPRRPFGLSPGSVYRFRFFLPAGDRRTCQPGKSSPPVKNERV